MNNQLEFDMFEHEANEALLERGTGQSEESTLAGEAAQQNDKLSLCATTLRQPNDWEARLQAVDPRYSYLVQAPAGSGKTELLTDRVLALLALVQRPEEILAITFTRKAAAEMRDRILKKLQRGLSNTEPEREHERQAWRLARQVLARDAELNWRLLEYPSRLRIQTIDAFCQSLIRLTPSLSGAGSSLNPTDFAQVLYQQAAQRTLMQVDKVKAVQSLLSHLDLNLSNAEKLLVEMLQSRDQWCFILDDESSALTQMVETLHRIVEQELEQAQQVMPLGWEQELQGALQEAAVHKTQADPEHLLANLMDWDGKPLSPSFADVGCWVAVANFLLTGKGELRKKVDARDGIGVKSSHKPTIMEWLRKHELNTELLEALCTIRDLPLQLIEAKNLETFKAFFTCLKLSLEHLQDIFKEQMQVDFIEIAQRASAALGQSDNPSDLLLKLDLSLKHILMDEFQDTSYSQMQLLEKLVSGWSDQDGRTLFLVGDPMQSIYRFRKAEVGLFLKVAEQQKVADLSIKRLNLSENFRSDQGVVEWVNRVFQYVFPAQNNAALGGISYSPSNPFNGPGARPAVQLYPFIWDKESETNTEAAQALRAEKTIVQLVKNALSNHPESEHPVVILVRGRNHLGQLAQLLQANNIPIKAVDIVALQNTPEVEDLVQLIRALLHEGDRLAWMALLRSPFCGLNLKSLTALFGQNFKRLVVQDLQRALALGSELEGLIGTEQAYRLRHFCGIVLQRPYHQSELSFPSYVENIWRQLGGFDVYASLAEQENIQTVLALLDKLAPYGNLDANEFQEQLNALYAAPASQGPAVEIMTMHKAKGLEFNEVIVYGLHRSTKSQKTALIEIEQQDGELLMGTVAHAVSKTKDSVSELIRSRNKKREFYETARLLYVASTRARENLHLVYLLSQDNLDNDQVSDKCMLSHIYPHITESMYCPEQDLTQLSASVVAPSSIANAWQSAYNNSQIDRLNLASLQILQPTIHPSWTGSIAAPVWQFDDKRQAAIGTVVHAWLEQISLDRLQDWSVERVGQAIPIMRQQLRQEGMAMHELDEAAKQVVRLLSGALLDERGRWLLTHPQATQEWRLSDEEGVEKIVDLAISDENGWLVVDYKTSSRFEHESQEEFIQRLKLMYREQLQQYMVYLQALDGRPARAAIYALDGCLWIEL